jgi:tousled-like kinase
MQADNLHFLLHIHSNKVDVWATGITFYQMIYGKVPFGAGISHDDYIAQHREIHRDGFEFPTHITMTEIGKRFIKSCLSDEPFRLNMSATCEHGYVRGSW